MDEPDYDEEFDICEGCNDFIREDNEADCLCCGDPLFWCYTCLPRRNRIFFNGKPFSFCDYCGTTFNENREDIFDDQFYQEIFNKTGVLKEDIIKKFREVQNDYFTREKQFARIDATIGMLQCKIKELEEEKTALSNLI